MEPPPPALSGMCAIDCSFVMSSHECEGNIQYPLYAVPPLAGMPPRRTSQRRWIYAAGYKIAWESRRFGEQENNIYGGISWLSTGPISLEASILANVWYPSGGMLSEKGVLVAGYGAQSGEFGRLAFMEAKFAASRAAVEKLHPGRGKELTKPIYVAWAKIPFTLGSWIRRDGYHEGPYKELGRSEA